MRMVGMVIRRIAFFFFKLSVWSFENVILW